ncbi:MAG: hypothetical protein ACOH5I_17120 [Oligoflexus sp.]
MTKMIFPKPTKCQAPFIKGKEAGLTFLEIIFSIMILLVLTTTAAMMIRNGIDMRIALSEQGRVTHRLEVAMNKVSQDLQHAFLLDRRRNETYFATRATKALFETSMRGGSSTLRLTTLTHQPLREHANESDQTFVVYELEKDEATGLTHLVRGQTPVIPQDFNDNDEIPRQVLAKYIKSFKIFPWSGDAWREDWNSDRSDFRDLLPHMVRIEMEAWDINPMVEEIIENEQELPTVTIRTVVYIANSWGMKETKQGNASIKYY